jgi:DNA-binding NtrC family response regulator
LRAEASVSRPHRVLNVVDDSPARAGNEVSLPEEGCAVAASALRRSAPTSLRTRARSRPQLLRRPTLAEVTRRYAAEILDQTGGNKTQAAQILGIDRRTLTRLLER